MKGPHRFFFLSNLTYSSAEAAATLIEYYNWTSAAIVYSDDVYGFFGAQAFQNSSEKHGFGLLSLQYTQGFFSSL
jgi:hypothetical protein